MKKRALALLLAATMVFGLTACGGNGNNASNEADNAAETTDNADDAAQPAETEAEEPAESTDDAQSETASTGEKILSVQVGPNPETIDPALNSAVDGGNMLLHSFECLLIVDQDGQLAPGQAETWETSEDGLTWTFHLRDGLKWSDGSDLTANDFVYSWKRVCDPEVAAPYA